MLRCHRNGYLVNATYTLPTDTAERDTDYLPTIGCSRLRCKRCGAAVRNAPGIAFASKADIEPAALAALYELPDLLKSPLVHRTTEDWRLYLCRCDRWLELYEHALEPADPDDSPGKPWQCEGHPPITLPHDVAGVRIASEQDIRELALRGLHGEAPPRTRDADREAAYWLLRLYYELEPSLASVIRDAAAGSIEDPDPAARAASIRFLFYTATDSIRELVFELLYDKRDLLAAPIDSGLAKIDTTIEDTAWRVAAPLLGRDGPARDYTRAEALAGRATRAMFDSLAAYDSEWLLGHIEELARAAPGKAGDLVDSFIRLPDDKQSAEHARRVRDALIGDGEPLDDIRRTARTFAKTARRDVPTEGDMTSIKLALPRLRDGTELELVIGAPPSPGRQRHLELRVIRTDRKTVTRTVKQGTKIDLIIFLDSAQVAERILYQAVEARR